MTPIELEAYDAMMKDRDLWRERAERLQRALATNEQTAKLEEVARENAKLRDLLGSVLAESAKGHNAQCLHCGEVNLIVDHGLSNVASEGRSE